MPIDTRFLDYLNRQFTPPDPQELEHNRQANALARIGVQNAQTAQTAMRNPASTPEDLARAGATQAASGVDEARRSAMMRETNARSVFGRAMDAIAQSPTPKQTAKQIVSTPYFQQAAQAAGLDPAKFVVNPEDTDDLIKTQADSWARASESGLGGSVQSTQIDNDGRLNAVMKNGTLRTLPGQYNKFAPKLIPDLAGAPGVMNNGVAQQLVSPEQQRSAAAATAGAKEGATTTAKLQAENAVSLPDALADIDKMRDGVKQLMAAPGFATIYGMAGVSDPRNFVPGTDAANARAMRDTMDAQAFGISIQKMRGLGSLSNAEGSKVTSAFTRATNPKISADEAKKAWNEVLYYLNLAEGRARQKAGQGGAAQPAAAPQGADNDPLGIR